MKSLKISVLSIILLMGLSSCNRGNVDRPRFSAEEAVEIVSNAIQNATNGLSEELGDIAENISETIAENYECNVTVDSSFTKTINNARVTAEYEVQWQWTPTCNDLDNMTALDYQSAMVGNYTGLRTTSEESSTTAVSTTGMQLASAVYTFDGTSSKNGNQTINVYGSKDIESVLNMTVQGIEVSKADNEISSGDVTFTLAVTLDDNEVVNFAGTIEFLGSRDAIIVINGVTYEVDL